MKLGYKLKRFVLESRRPSKWRRASKEIKQEYPYCQICYVVKELEAHDVVPYRFFENPNRISVAEWKRNMIVLTHDIHFLIAHKGDPSWLKFNMGIRKIAEFIKEMNRLKTSKRLNEIGKRKKG